MGQFTRVDPKGKTDRELLIASLKQAEAVHGCLESHITNFNRFEAEQRLASLDATEKRLSMKEDLSDLKGTVTEQGGKIEKIILGLGVEKPKAGQKKPRGHGLATWGVWKVLTAVSGCFTVLLVLFQLSVKVAPVIFDYLMSLSP